ncbi:MAG: hypothetical protein A4E58_01791 [Syntrophorhabdus sp. PtaB.Bin006]|nr:MAG: hypothetical protein A4E58_01791 [Syntrophorhabdus sp. PtaB.Bin006]
MMNKNASRPIGLSRVIANIVIVCLCLLLSGFGGAKISGTRDVGTAPTYAPQMIYVTDFDLEVQDIQSDPGLVQSLRQGRGPRADILPRPRSAHKDPAVQARELVDLMSTSLVKEFGKLGFKAQRVNPGMGQPTNGLLVRGVFTQVGEGNHLRRAVIGFGAGETELQVMVAVDDLSQGAPKSFYELSTSAESRKLPGAAITMNPYVGAAKFVLSSRDLDKNVTQTASKIAADIDGRIRKQDGRSEQIPTGN